MCNVYVGPDVLPAMRDHGWQVGRNIGYWLLFYSCRKTKWALAAVVGAFRAISWMICCWLGTSGDTKLVYSPSLPFSNDLHPRNPCKCMDYGGGDGYFRGMEGWVGIVGWPVAQMCISLKLIYRVVCKLINNSEFYLRYFDFCTGCCMFDS